MHFQCIELMAVTPNRISLYKHFDGKFEQVSRSDNDGCHFQMGVMVNGGFPVPLMHHPAGISENCSTQVQKLFISTFHGLNYEVVKSPANHTR